MPIYEAKCLTCGREEDYFRPVAQYLDTPECCGYKMEKLISAPNLSPDIANWDTYVSPATGKTISSKAQRRADMKASGCRDWEGMESEKKQAARNKEYDEVKQDKKLDESVRTAYAQLPSEKKAQLAKELGG